MAGTLVPERRRRLVEQRRQAAPHTPSREEADGPAPWKVVLVVLVVVVLVATALISTCFLVAKLVTGYAV